MADPRSDSDIDDDTGTPLWVKGFGIIFAVVVVLFLTLLFTRGPHRGHGGHRVPSSPSAIVVFLALGIVGLTSQNAQTVRGVYLAMEPAAWAVLVPFALASLLTGTVQSLGTTWGLFRHYWVLFKLLITVFATIFLLIYMETFRVMAGVAADPTADLALVRSPSPRFHAVLALLVLLVANVLAIYKPRGLTPYGRRKQREQRRVSATQ